MSGKQVVAPWLLPKISQNNEILGPVLNSIKKGAISKSVHISPARDKQAEQGEEAPIATPTKKVSCIDLAKQLKVQGADSLRRGHRPAKLKKLKIKANNAGADSAVASHDNTPQPAQHYQTAKRPANGSKDVPPYESLLPTRVASPETTFNLQQLPSQPEQAEFKIPVYFHKRIGSQQIQPQKLLGDSVPPGSGNDGLIGQLSRPILPLPLKKV